MKAKILFYAKAWATIGLGCLTVSCASPPSDQFGFAVTRGSVSAAAAHNGPNFANMQIWKTPRQYAVPMQYAIMQGNKPMASFLLANGANHSLGGENLAYYSAANGRRDMAEYFIGRGIGSESDLSRAASAQASQRSRDRASMQVAGLIGFGILAAMAHSGGGGDYNRNSDGFTEQEDHDMTAAKMQWERDHPSE